VISGLSGNLTTVFMVWAPPHFTALFYTGNFSSRKTGNLAGLPFMVTENHQSSSRNDYNKTIKPSRKDTQKSSPRWRSS
jgi:hypothetical protein